MKLESRNLYTAKLCKFILGNYKMGESNELVTLEYLLLYKVNGFYVKAVELNAVKLHQLKKGNTAGMKVYTNYNLAGHLYLDNIIGYPFGKEKWTMKDVRKEQARFDQAYSVNHKPADYYDVIEV